MEYKPPFTINENIINMLAEISELVGQIGVTSKDNISPRLRRDNRIKTIHSSLAIEHNTLSLDQVTAVINGKRVLGEPREIREVQNAYDAYEVIREFDPFKIEDLLRAHGIMMNGLVSESGCFRTGDVGIFDGDKLVHAAPPADLVPQLISNLFRWYAETEIHILIKSCIFHYEFEFIHPFSDGNGRIGRMWHTLLLSRWNKIFEWLPIEELIKERQKDYYNALAASDKSADCADFVEMMMKVIRDALLSLNKTDQDTDQVSDQVKALLDCLGNKELSAVQLMERLNLSHRPTFRKNYLRPALESGLIEMTIPNKPNSRNQKYRKK